MLLTAHTTECRLLKKQLASSHETTAGTSALLEQVKRLSTEKSTAEATAVEVLARCERLELEVAASREQALHADGMNREIQKLSRESVRA
jgi:hypothetical protein